jgi:hypothetical protein
VHVYLHKTCLRNMGQCVFCGVKREYN